jgi:hypothetical protein
MHSLEVIRHTNEDAVLKHYNCLKWSGKLKTLVDLKKKHPVTDRTFHDKAQAVTWLRIRGFEDIVVV